MQTPVPPHISGQRSDRLELIAALLAAPLAARWNQSSGGQAALALETLQDRKTQLDCCRHSTASPAQHSTVCCWLQQIPGHAAYNASSFNSSCPPQACGKQQEQLPQGRGHGCTGNPGFQGRLPAAVQGSKSS